MVYCLLETMGICTSRRKNIENFINEEESKKNKKMKSLPETDFEREEMYDSNTAYNTPVRVQSSLPVNTSNNLPVGDTIDPNASISDIIWASAAAMAIKI